MMDKSSKEIVCLQVHNEYQIPGGETKSAIRIGDLLESYGIKVIRYYKDNHSFENVGGHNVMPIISDSVYSVLIQQGIPIIKYIQNYNLICLNGGVDHGERCNQCKTNCWNGVRIGCYKGSKAYSFIKYIAKRQIDTKYLSKISAFMPNSGFVKNKHKEFGMNVDKMFVMYNYIDPEVKRIETNNYKSYYLYFGRITKEKGIMTVVSAFKGYPNLQLIFMGSGEYEEELIRGIEGYNNIQFIGNKSGKELKNILSNAKCVIVPSEWDEPLPRTILEALSFGIPIIGASSGGITEMLKPSIGISYAPGNVDELKEALTRFESLSASEYREMRENCLRECEEMYTRESYFKRFCACLKYIGVLNNEESN